MATGTNTIDAQDRALRLEWVQFSDTDRQLIRQAAQERHFLALLDAEYDERYFGMVQHIGAEQVSAQMSEIATQGQALADIATDLDKFLRWIGAINDARQPANVRMLRAS